MAGVYRAERRKLLAQLSTRLLAFACVLGPAAFAVIVSQQSGFPTDSLLGIWVHSSGYAVSFLLLGFAGSVGFAIIAGVTAGDLFSSEDRYGTWKTVLTRSRSRGELFAGKLLVAATFSVALAALVALSSLAAGLLSTGDRPLVGLSGRVVPSGECLWLVIASWLLTVPPLLAFTSLAALFSVVTRNGIAGVLGTVLAALVMQLLALIGNGTWVHTLLVASAFDGWHGLLSTPKFYSPSIIGSCVCVAWILICLSASWAVLRKRDFAGPPGTRAAGWIRPGRAALVSAALIAVLAAASNLGPVAITKARLESSIGPAFNKLTSLQQEELGRRIPHGSQLNLLTQCTRRSGKSEGAGDDWSCTMTVVSPRPGYSPLEVKPVTYDVGVKPNGCYKAQAPPSFVGQQTMSDAHGHSVVNPLFTIYGCFDTTGAASRCPEYSQCPRGSKVAPRGSRAPGPPAVNRAPERALLREAEHKAGPRVMREIEEAEKAAQREAEHPGRLPSEIGK